MMRQRHHAAVHRSRNPTSLPLTVLCAIVFLFSWRQFFSLSPRRAHAPPLAADMCTGRLVNTDAVMLLAQKRHSTYDATHNTDIHATLTLLARNYPALPHADVLIWHEAQGDNRFSLSDVAASLPPTVNVRLCSLEATLGAWGPPRSLRSVPRETFWIPYVAHRRFHVRWPFTLPSSWACRRSQGCTRESRWSVGYRSMCRWYAVSMWPVLQGLGYRWVMRLDDDSEILSPMAANNVFDTMRSEGKRYGYRLYSKECSESFNAFVTAYIRNKATNHTLLSAADGDYCAGIGIVGYYNNWFVTEIAWWMTPAVREFALAFDDSHLTWTRRDNDLVFQTAAVRLFMPRTQRRLFLDFSYQHHTIMKGEVVWGGLAMGTTENRTSSDIVAAYMLDGARLTHHGLRVFECAFISELGASETGSVIVQHGDAPFCPTDPRLAL